MKCNAKLIETIENLCNRSLGAYLLYFQSVLIIQMQTKIVNVIFQYSLCFLNVYS